MAKIWDVVIVGAGPAGLAAGLYAARAGAETLILEKTAAGGQMLQTHVIRNYPGVLSTTGADLAATMRAQAERAGAKFADAAVLQVEPLADEPEDGSNFHLVTDDGKLLARAVIAATGTTPRRLNLPGEAELVGPGISYCATCDAPLFAGQDVAVYGGGNSALYSALELAKIANQVYLLHHNQNLRADHTLQQRVSNEPKIKTILGAKITELSNANGQLSSIRLTPTDGELVPASLEVSGLFVVIGREADTALFDVDKDEQGHILVDANFETSLPYLYAAGDIVAGPLRQIITAAADGAIAAVSACRKLLLKK